MINVKRVSLMLILSFLLLIVGSTVALALTTVSAGQTFYYDPWSPDYGSKRQYFTLSYYGDEWEGTDPFGSSFQAVEKQDFFIYRDDKWVIWPPEVGNGKAKLIKVELQNSSGSTVVTQQNSEWEDGTYRDYMFSTDSIRYTFRRNSTYPLLKLSYGN